MATGIRKLMKIQMGDETTAGTAAAADVMWRGPGASIEALDAIEFVAEDIGSYGDANRTAKMAVGAQLGIPETLFTFEQFPLLCQMGIEAQQTGVADSTGSGKIYTFDFPLTSANTIRTYTVEAGDNEDCADMEYSFCSEFGVRGEPDGGIMVSGILRGRQKTPGQSFASLTAPTVNSAVFNLSSLYLDTAGGTMGTTPITCAFLGFRINTRTGLIPLQSGDGNLYFCNVEQGGWEITADVAFKHTGDADSEEANWIAQTARLMEIRLEGVALTTAGDYTNMTAKFQLPGKWQKFGVYEDRNGVNIVTGSFLSKYDPTAALGPKVVVVNETTSYW